MIPSAHAGIVTSLLSADNTKNDQVQDKSVGYVLDLDTNGIDTGDIGWGVIRVDKINNTNIGNKVFIVYAAQLTSGSSPFSHTFVPEGNNYSVKSILGAVASGIDYSYGGPLAVLLETSADVTLSGVDFDQGTNSNKPSDLKTEIQSAFASAQLIATFGLATGNTDYYTLTGSLPTLTQNLELSVLQSFVGPVTDWKTLFDPYPLDGQDWTDNEVAIKPGSIEAISSHTDDGAYFKTADSGTYHVNYVPEPASMIGLASLALAGAGLGFVRRRKA
ncbi:MAG: hypothetical protein Kow0040_01970 [Thermogutta sp.]